LSLKRILQPLAGELKNVKGNNSAHCYAMYKVGNHRQGEWGQIFILTKVSLTTIGAKGASALYNPGTIEP